jgi:hypothetical protein
MRSHSSASNEVTTRRAAISLCTRMMSSPSPSELGKYPSWVCVVLLGRPTLYGKGEKNY